LWRAFGHRFGPHVWPTVAAAIFTLIEHPA
jgi:hypothetical protein